MKRFIEILKIMTISIVMGIIVLIVTKSHYISCSGLEVFNKSSSYASMFGIGVAFGIWIIGFILYYSIKKKKKIYLLIYFPLLTIISLHQNISEVVHREPEKDRAIKQQICNKSSDDGMMLIYLNLDKTEYDFINSKSKWLPEVPLGAKEININYYRDDFLGDFSLKIELRLKKGERLDVNKFPEWILNGSTYSYQRFQT